MVLSALYFGSVFVGAIIIAVVTIKLRSNRKRSEFQGQKENKKDGQIVAIYKSYHDL